VFMKSRGGNWNWNCSGIMDVSGIMARVMDMLCSGSSTSASVRIEIKFSRHGVVWYVETYSTVE
jgi:hypothetical protein